MWAVGATASSRVAPTCAHGRSRPPVLVRPATHPALPLVPSSPAVTAAAHLRRGAPRVARSGYGRTTGGGVGFCRLYDARRAAFPPFRATPGAGDHSRPRHPRHRRRRARPDRYIPAHLGGGGDQSRAAARGRGGGAAGQADGARYQCVVRFFMAAGGGVGRVHVVLR